MEFEVLLIIGLKVISVTDSIYCYH